MSRQSELSRMVEDILQELKPWTADIIDRVFRYIEEERNPNWSQLYWEKRRATRPGVVNTTIGRLVRRHIEKEYRPVVRWYRCHQGSNLIRRGYTVLYGRNLLPCSKWESCPNWLVRSGPTARKLYYLQNISTLLTEGFNEADLWQFCYDNPDFRPLHQSLTNSVKKFNIVSQLLQYAYMMGLIETLLTWAKKINPVAYEQYQPYYEKEKQENQPLAKSQAFNDRYDKLHELVHKLRLDAAVPHQVALGRVFDLAVSVRLPFSPVLDEKDLPQVRSGNVQVFWPEDEPFIRLRIQVNAAECEIQGMDSCRFRLYKDQDGPVFYFQLIPKEVGIISIKVAVFQKNNWLGGARVQTVAQERVVGQVHVDVSSRSVSELETQKEWVEELIFEHSRRLHKLEVQQARYGISADPHILIEIEDIETEIATLEAKLKELEQTQ